MNQQPNLNQQHTQANKLRDLNKRYRLQKIKIHEIVEQNEEVSQLLEVRTCSQLQIGPKQRKKLSRQSDMINLDEFHLLGDSIVYFSARKTIEPDLGLQKCEYLK